MIGMIFAAGIGSRLKPWTDSHPKALVPVGGVPMLKRVIDKLVKLGVSRIIVNVHHFAQQIVDYLATIECRVEIVVSDETDRLLDTGGGLVKALPLIGDNEVIIHNADVLETVDLKGMIDFHHNTGAQATLLVDPRVTSRRFVFSADDRLRGWTNTDTSQVRPDGLKIDKNDLLRAFDGVHVISPVLFPALVKFAGNDAKFSITDFYILNADKADIMGYEIPRDAHWFDVGKPETLNKAQEFITQNSYV